MILLKDDGKWHLVVKKTEISLHDTGLARWKCLIFALTITTQPTRSWRERDTQYTEIQLIHCSERSASLRRRGQSKVTSSWVYSLGLTQTTVTCVLNGFI